MTEQTKNFNIIEGTRSEIIADISRMRTMGWYVRQVLAIDRDLKNGWWITYYSVILEKKTKAE